MSPKLTAVFNAIDKINSQDPNKILLNNQLQPKALIYGHQMTACLNTYWPDSDDLLQIAVRAQHIKRWHLKRQAFETGKKGYYQWRIALGKYHAELTQQLMLEYGYNTAQAQTTATIIRKENIKRNSQSQTLENVACLVFLQYYLDDFVKKHCEEKVIRILQKTWNKMSESAQHIVLNLNLPEHLNKLVINALTNK